MDNFEKYLDSSEIKSLMNKAVYNFKKSIDFEELESIKMLTLWKCVNKYDKDKGAKFTSFLFSQLGFAGKNHLKKKRKEYNCEKIEVCDMRNDTGEFFDTLDGLPEEVVKIIRQRFIYNMTMTEIGSQNGYSRETARRRLLRAVRLCKKANYSNI